MHDDEDWVGTPPEGHHARDPEREAFWRAQWQKGLVGAGVVMAVVVVLAMVLLVR
jgi:hypothetical protein